MFLQDDADYQRGVPASPYILRRQGYKLVCQRSTSRVRLVVLYMDPNMSGFLTEY
jgi:hypothetical protein